MSELKHRAENVLGYSTVISSIGFDEPKRIGKKVIVLIPGNPGLIEFYQVFMKKLYELTKIPIIGFSHAGHSPTHHYTDDKMHTPALGLQEQIEHKVQCLKRFVPDDLKIIFIGHSIGAYVALQLMNKSPERSLHGVLLFPTIAHMAKTQDGRFWSMVTSYFKLPFLYVAHLSSYLPYSVQDLLVGWRTKWRDIDPLILSVCRRCVCWDVLHQGFSMVETELEEVADITPELSEIVHKNSDKLSVYYGDEDSWTPYSFYEEFVSEFPEVKTIFGRHGFKHDFVLDSSAEVAELCNGFIQEL